MAKAVQMSEKEFVTDLKMLSEIEEGSVEYRRKTKSVFVRPKKSRLKYVVEKKLNWSWFVSLGSSLGNFWNGKNVKKSQELTGGSGSDVIHGGLGNDIIYGVGGKNKLYGREGNDRMYGGDKNDLMKGGNGNDTLEGGYGNDKMYGNNGKDVLDGQYGHDLLDGGKGADILYGGLGDDTLLGGNGNDVLIGHDGDDVLDGGLGNDVLEGREGKDVFLFSTKLGKNNIDLISDFDKGDVILLKRSVFKKLDIGELSSNHYVGNTSGRALDRDDHIIYNLKTGALSYDPDGNGEAAAVQFATLANSGWSLRSGQIVVVA